jgi:hypothetical protein
MRNVLMQGAVAVVFLSVIVGGCGMVEPSGTEGAPDGGTNTQTTDDGGDGGGTPSAADGGTTSPADGDANTGTDGAPERCPGVVINPTVQRFDANGSTPYPYRPANEGPTWLDAQDCDDNIVLQFSLLLCGLPTTDTFQVWAGATDCTQTSARVPGSNGPFCWRVAPDIPASQSAASNVFARDVAVFIGDPSSDVLNFTPLPNSTPAVSACHALGTPSQCTVRLSVYFMAVESDNITVDGASEYSFGVFVAPPAGGACPGG